MVAELDRAPGQPLAEEPLVTVSVVIPAAVPGFSQGTLHVRLEEVSRADAPSLTVAEARLPGVSHRGAPDQEGETQLTLPVRGPACSAERIDPRHDYAVRVWIDLGEGGTPGHRGPSTDQRYPALTRGFGRSVTVRLGP
jgi:hypothetical protein